MCGTKWDTRQEAEHLARPRSISIPGIAQHFTLQESLTLWCCAREGAFESRPGALAQHMLQQLRQALPLDRCQTGKLLMAKQKGQHQFAGPAAIDAQITHDSQHLQGLIRGHGLQYCEDTLTLNALSRTMTEQVDENLTPVRRIRSRVGQQIHVELWRTLTQRPMQRHGPFMMGQWETTTIQVFQQYTFLHMASTAHLQQQRPRAALL